MHDKQEQIKKHTLIAAKKEGLTMSELAHAFVYQQPFIGSTIIGGTNLQQLQQNIKAQNIRLSPECFKSLDKVHAQYPNPCP